MGEKGHLSELTTWRKAYMKGRNRLGEYLEVRVGEPWSRQTIHAQKRHQSIHSMFWKQLGVLCGWSTASEKET